MPTSTRHLLLLLEASLLVRVAARVVALLRGARPIEVLRLVHKLPVMVKHRLGPASRDGLAATREGDGLRVRQAVSLLALPEVRT